MLQHRRGPGLRPLRRHPAQVHVAPVQRHLLRRRVQRILVRIPQFHRGVDVEHAVVMAPLENFAGVNVPRQINQEIPGAQIFAQQRAQVLPGDPLMREFHAELDPGGERRLAVLEIHDRDVFGRRLEVLHEDGQRALRDRTVANEQNLVFE